MEKDSEKLYLDEEYIPELLKGIKDEELLKRMQHVLYTYSRRAKFYKRLYLGLTLTTIICPALATVVNTFSCSDFSWTNVAVVLLSAVTTCAAGAMGVVNVRENWISYRVNCELLKEEIFKYVEKYDPYNMSDNESKALFINNTFNLYHEESIVWKKNTRVEK